jgi:hypothetical protein
MKKIKTSELTGPALDWAVATCEGKEIFLDRETPEFMCLGEMSLYRFSPTTYWAQGGPIIERERIDLQAKINAGSDYDEWVAVIGIGPNQRRRYGPTPLVAAMRCYVAYKLGYEVEIPEELAKST